MQEKRIFNIGVAREARKRGWYCSTLCHILVPSNHSVSSSSPLGDDEFSLWLECTPIFRCDTQRAFLNQNAVKKRGNSRMIIRIEFLVNVEDNDRSIIAHTVLAIVNQNRSQGMLMTLGR